MKKKVVAIKDMTVVNMQNIDEWKKEVRLVLSCRLYSSFRGKRFTLVLFVYSID